MRGAGAWPLVPSPSSCFFGLHRLLGLGFRRLVALMIAAAGRGPAAAASAVHNRVGHVAVEYRGGVIVWGGYREARTHEYWPTGEVVIFEPEWQAWRVRPTCGHPPDATCGAAAAVLGDEMFILCGFRRRGSQDSENSEAVDDMPEGADVNEVWALNLTTWAWRKIWTSGRSPLRCNKLVSWVHGGKIYVFGGFGPKPAPPDPAMTTFLPERTGGYSSRGWNNQLACLNPELGRWEWPECVNSPPTPRAAHAAIVRGNDVFLFGGRMGPDRLNDLYHLDAVTLRWRRIHGATTSNEDVGIKPCGRSWHSFTLYSSSMAVLYGGYCSNGEPQGDCWVLDVNAALAWSPSTAPQSPPVWSRCNHLDSGKRLWHQAVKMPATGEVWVLGGVRDDLLDYNSTIRHPSSIAKLALSPKSLRRLSLEVICKNKKQFSKDSLETLPVVLRREVKVLYHTAKPCAVSLTEPL